MTATNVPSPVPPPIRKMIKIWYLTASTGSTPAKIWPVIIPGSDTSPAAAMLLQSDAVDITFAHGRYGVAEGDLNVTLIEAAEAAGGLDESADYAARAKTFANGCHVCEVEVDPETGRVTIVGYTVADDAGRLLNPMLAAGQVHGGLAQGIGQRGV